MRERYRVMIIILVEIAFETALPLRERARKRESREEFAEWARRRRPLHFSQRLDHVLCCYVLPIHTLPTRFGAATGWNRSRRRRRESSSDEFLQIRIWVRDCSIFDSCVVMMTWHSVGRNTKNNKMSEMSEPGFEHRTSNVWNYKKLKMSEMSEPGVEPGTSSVWD